MATLREAARITVSKRDFGMDHVTPKSPLEDRAKLIWMAARRQAQLGGVPDVREGRLGVRAQFTMSSLVESLFFELSKSELEREKSLVNQVLRSVGAAVCIAHGKGITSTWFVADDMPDNLVAVAAWISARSADAKLPGGRPMELTNAEKRLTPSEAGEDRLPKPVTTTSSKALFGELIIAALRDAGQPLSVTEVAAAVARPDSVARYGLNRLFKRGEVFTRIETRDERILRSGQADASARRATLYSLTSPVPERTVKEAVPGVTLVTHSLHGSDVVTVDELANTILGFIAEASAHLSMSELARLTGAHRTNVDRAIDRLLELGLVIDDRKLPEENTMPMLLRSVDKVLERPARKQPRRVTPTVAVAAVEATASPRVQDVAALIDKLVAAAMADLQAENARLHVEVVELKTRLANVKAAFTA